MPPGAPYFVMGEISTQNHLIWFTPNNKQQLVYQRKKTAYHGLCTRKIFKNHFLLFSL